MGSNSVSADYQSTNQIRSSLAVSLARIFGNKPQRPSPADGDGNAGYTFVRGLAEKVYDFTTFAVRLEDTSRLFVNDPGAGDLKTMFGNLMVEAGGQWNIFGVGYSIGECNLLQQDQEWWLMPSGCREFNEGLTHIVEGDAYIENTGGGTGSQVTIPDSVRPQYWYSIGSREWFQARYGTMSNTNTMLGVYGDVLYPAAVAYGAGLLEAFLDEAIMPRPITSLPVPEDGANVRLVGYANAGRTNTAAWFEWGPSSDYGNRTAEQSIGTGSTWLSVSARIQGLDPDTTYHYRLVSSNRFGVRYGTNQTFRTPSFILAGNGMNAWQITDNSEASGSTLRYVTNLTVPQPAMATSDGWKLTVTSRFVTDFGDTKAINASYVQGGQRFLFGFDLDSAGDLTVELEGQLARKLTTNGVGATDYHTHEVHWINGKATYRFDGIVVVVTNWAGFSTSSDPAGQVSWGGGSSGGRGQMNFHRVEFAIGGSNVVAAYNAGTAGNPVETPAPNTQGWIRLAGATLLPEGPLSPDGEPSLPLVETLAASGLGLQGGQLNGRTDPRGRPALTWFEWGATTSYGNVTELQIIPNASGWTNVNAQLSALTQETTYYYRLVASNSFGIRFGTNRTLTTPSYLLTGALPNAWQITDNSETSGALLNYTNHLGLAQRTAAANNGWRLRLISRLLTDFDDTGTMTASYSLGNKRFLFWLDHDAAGDLELTLDGPIIRKLTTNGIGATNYHTCEIQFSNGVASFWFDGTLVVSNWPGLTLSEPAGLIRWGAVSNPGRGQMNFHRLEFEIVGSGVVASYNAGTRENAAADPNPTNQGWRFGGGATISAVSPDAVPFQPIADAETLVASAVGPNAAQFNASVNPRGQPTTIWFEFGATPGYGNRTTNQNFAGSGATPFAQGVSGLTVDTTYYYRVVASNAFAVSFGSPQTFRTRWFQDSGISLAAVDVGSIAWGDFDNDGDLDLIVTGQADTNQVTELYRNVGGTNLVAVNSGLPRVNQSAVAWGDYDNDGYLDLAISGWHASGPISRVYRNLRDGTFADVNAGLPGLRMSSVTWSDYDNDGDLDLLLTGLDDAATNGMARLYQNDRGTNFVDSGANLPRVHRGSVAWADFDGDGDQDFILTGRLNSQILISRIYRNDGGGNFSDIVAPLPGTEANSVAWGDYDGDGDPDLLLTGWDGGIYITHLIRNDRNGGESTWIDVSANLPGLSASSVGWGDYDNDGDLDILTAGWSGNFSANIFRNDAAGVFADIGAELAGVNWSSAAWADFDGDGDLDALVTGSTASSRVCHLYRNGITVPNVRPTAPTGLAGSGVANTATLSWNPATDTTSGPLTYNVILRTTTNGVNLTAAMSDAATGFRRLVQPGNAAENLSWTFVGLKPGTYYFTVQAIDSSFAGGPFAPWQSLEVIPQPVAIIDAHVLAPGRFRLQFVTPEGGAYEVLRSVDLSTWNAIGSAVQLSPGLWEFVDVDAPAQRTFYRIRSTAP